MNLLHVVVLLGAGVLVAGDGEFDYTPEGGYRTPPAAILVHKQALSQDGNFNYVFSAENGLKQGETIGPDGTRRGGYSYVDPSGKTITVKYTAGKDGFKILEGDHVPRPAAQAPVAQQYQPQQHYQPQPQPHLDQPQPHYDQPQYDRPAPHTHRQQQFRPEPSAPHHTHRTGEAGAWQPTAQDQHRGPHSWGTGYSFEFSG